MEQLYLGIDLGTSAMKIVLINEERRILAKDSEEYELSEPEEGWSEINQELWFDSMVCGIRKIMAGRDTSRLRSIGFTGQMHTLIVLDKEGRYIRPALMWNDLRTTALIPELKERLLSFKEGEYLSRTISTGSPAANLYWLKRYEPENFTRIGKFLIGFDYLTYRLTGRYCTDYCGASTSCLYETGSRRWSAQMREYLGLPETAYPEICGSAQTAGTITEEMAELLGLSKDVAVLVGTGDNPASAISTGCLGSGYPVISLGTSGVLIIPDSSDGSNKYGKKILFSFDDGVFFNLVQGAVQSNGSTVAWWTQKIMGSSDFSCIDQAIDLEKEKKNRVVFYPHITGDKTLYGDPTLRGAFVGLSMNCECDDLLYSVLEGLCFGFRELSEKMCLDIRENGCVKVVGGGARSRVWMQTLANVLNHPVEQMDGMIGAAFGVALLAAYRDGGGTDYGKAAEKTVSVRRRFVPEPEMVKICERKYQVYKRMHDGLKYITDGKPVVS